MTLHTEVGGYWVKIHGGPFQRVGLPDLIGCVNGLFFGLEVKLEGETYEPIQEREAIEIRHKGQGVAACIHSPREAVDVVRKALSQAKTRPRIYHD
jgi:hypothetical protein